MQKAIQITATLFVLLLLFPAAPAAAQVTEISTQDLLDLIGTDDVAQVFETGALDPSTTPALSTVLAATGPNQTYDLRSLSYTFRAEGVIRYRTIADATALGWPGSGDEYLSTAEQAFALDLRTPSGDGTGTVYSYHTIETSGPNEGDNSYGGAFETSMGSFTNTFDPPLLQYSTPLVYAPTPTTWSSTSGGQTISGEVEGYGTIRTPAGDFEVMRIRRESTFSGFAASTDYEFITPDAGFTVATIEGDGTGSYTVNLTAISDDFAEAPVSAGQTGGIVSDNRLAVSFASGSTAAGQLAIATFNRRPFNPTFDGSSAPSDDGTSITPDVLFENQYYLVYDVDDTLDGFTAEVCFDAATVPGVSDPQKVVLLTRDFPSSPWSPLATALNGSSACATVTTFSQFALGSNSSFNALPVELAGFDAVADEGRALLTWSTLQERGNDGFRIAHRTGGSSFAMIGRVDGAGTTDRPQDYRFRTEPLAPGRHTFRLVQIDLDGTATPVGERTVRIQAPATIALSAPAPNPASARSSVTLTLPETRTVTVEVFDLLGRRQTVLHDGPLAGGTTHTFDIDVSAWASGTYLVRVAGTSAPTTTRLTVIR